MRELLRRVARFGKLFGEAWLLVGRINGNDFLEDGSGVHTGIHLHNGYAGSVSPAEGHSVSERRLANEEGVTREH